jgi:hypothetical protein
MGGNKKNKTFLVPVIEYKYVQIKTTITNWVCKGPEEFEEIKE